MDIEQVVRKIIAEISGTKEDAIKRETQFADDLGMDSMDAIEAMVLIESELDIDLLESSVEGVSTFGELVDELTKLIASEADSVESS